MWRCACSAFHKLKSDFCCCCICWHRCWNTNKKKPFCLQMTFEALAINREFMIILRIFIFMSTQNSEQCFELFDYPHRMSLDITPIAFLHSYITFSSALNRPFVVGSMTTNVIYISPTLYCCCCACDIQLYGIRIGLHSIKTKVEHLKLESSCNIWETPLCCCCHSQTIFSRMGDECVLYIYWACAATMVAPIR